MDSFKLLGLVNENSAFGGRRCVGERGLDGCGRGVVRGCADDQYRGEEEVVVGRGGAVVGEAI